MAKTLTFSKETVQVLVSTELDAVQGGAGHHEPFPDADDILGGAGTRRPKPGDRTWKPGPLGNGPFGPIY